MQFYETVMGRRFFDGQLPALIKAIDRLSEAVEESNRLRREEVIAPAEESDRCE